MNKNYFTEKNFENFLNKPNRENIKKDSSLSDISEMMTNYLIEDAPFYNFVNNFTISGNINYEELDKYPFYNIKTGTYNIKKIKKDKFKLYEELIKLYKPLQDKIELDFADNDSIAEEMVKIMNKTVCSNGLAITDQNEIFRRLRYLYPDVTDQTIIDFIFDWYKYDKKKKIYIFDIALKNCNYDLSKLKKIDYYVQLLDSFRQLYNSRTSNNIDNSLNNFMNNLVTTVNNEGGDYRNFLNNMVILTSLKKTMGDFSQILYCNCFENNSDDLNIFFSFDIIATHISSLFNATLGENIENPLLPMKLLYASRNNNNNFGKYNKNNSDKVSKLSKVERIHNLAKKYNVSYKNLTYKQLYDKLHKLYKLQLLAKKKKIPITYTKKETKQSSKNKRIYKSISMLEKETKKLNKNK
jgi:hypothetical protein